MFIFRLNVLELTEGVEHPGYIRWQLLLCLLGAWTVVFLCLIKGIKSSGKVCQEFSLFTLTSRRQSIQGNAIRKDKVIVQNFNYLNQS